MSRTILAVSACFVFVTGCGNQIQTADDAAGRVTAEPLSSTIPPGIYIGTTTARQKVWHDGVLQVDETDTSSSTEVIDSAGLPSMSPDLRPVATDQVITAEFGDLEATMTIKSVVASGDRVAVTYTVGFEFEGVDATGTGQTTFDFEEPGTLHVVTEYALATNVNDAGHWARFDYLANTVANLDGVEAPSNTQSDPTDLFPQVTNAIRVACENWIPDDASVSGVINAFEADRQNGITEIDAIRSVNEIAFDPMYVPDDPAARSAYVACMLAIVDEVWP